jgi:sirohydrochlorin cobaltochelatase
MAWVYGIPIGRNGRRRPVPAGAEEGLLLVAHGSVCAGSAREVDALASLVSDALPGVAVAVGYLEMSEPPAGPVVDELVAAGCRRVVVLPLMLLGAGHAKSDVPAVVQEARLRHPHIDLPFGAPLGVTRAPVELLGKAVVASGGAGLPLLLVARGTSDPDANAEACKAGRLLAEWTGAPFAYVGFSGVTDPAVPEAAQVFARLGFGRLAVAWWFLGHGKLIERGRHDLARFAHQTGVQIVDAGHLGAKPALVPVIVERYQQAQSGVALVNCDTCAYRAPWPGREDRVGQAIGVGHSHLAIEHRQHGQHGQHGPGHRH